jgi:putative ABC transport system substrate-binding protein
MKRRDVITLLGGAAVTWPLAARAQQSDRMRCVGMLMGESESEDLSAKIAIFVRRLNELGWKEARDLRIETRWWNGHPMQMGREAAAALLALPADVMVTWTNLALELLKPMLGGVPAVFVGVGDPVGSGFVDSLARPGANITGFSSYDPPMGGKWLQTLKETAPHLTNVLVIMHAETPNHQGFWRSIQEGAPSLGIEPTQAAVHDGAEIEAATASFATKQNGGLVVLPHTVTNSYSRQIIALEQRYRLPAIHTSRPEHALAGGLVFYGVDFDKDFRRAAEYVDQILKGKKPSELPVQAPTKYRLIINLKTAKVLGINVPPSLLLRSDELIE